MSAVRSRAVLMVGSVLATLGLAALTPVAPAHGTVPGFNGRIVFHSKRTGNFEIYTLNPDGTGLTNLTNNPADDVWPAWSPDGSEIAFFSSRSPAGIYEMNADGSNPHLVASGGGLWIAWSGDGSKIEYVAQVNGSPHIWTMNRDGTGQTDIAAGFFPAWSPDGAKIVFKGWVAGAGIYVMNADGSNPVRLTDPGSSVDQAPSFSPDGTKIVFNRTAPSPDTNNSAQLWVMNADGSNQTQLTSLSGYSATGRYSPDGKRIVFQQSATTSDGPFHLVTMKADGSGVQNLTNTSFDDEFPDWQPLSQAPPATSVTVSLTKQSIPADGTATSVVTATLKNAYGDPVTDENVVFATDGDVTFGPVNNRGDGTYTSTVRASQTPGSETVMAKATIANVSGSAPLTEIPLGMVLDGWGGVHPFGAAPAVGVSGYWPGWDIARGIADHNVTSGYVLDGWGGVHPYGGAPAVGISGYWPGLDIARGIAIDPADPNGRSGYVLDGWGGVHPFGGAPAVTVSAFWPGWDIVRGIVINSRNPSQNYVTGYVLDGWGGIHAFWQTGRNAISSPAPSAFWPGWDIARGIVSSGVGFQGYVLDGWGGVHPYGGAPAVGVSGYWQGWDIVRGLTYIPSLHGGYVLDGWGGVHSYGAAPVVAPTASWPGWDIARGAAG